MIITIADPMRVDNALLNPSLEVKILNTSSPTFRRPIMTMMRKPKVRFFLVKSLSLLSHLNMYQATRSQGRLNMHAKIAGTRLAKERIARTALAMKRIAHATLRMLKI